MSSDDELLDFEDFGGSSLPEVTDDTPKVKPAEKKVTQMTFDNKGGLKPQKPVKGVPENPDDPAQWQALLDNASQGPAPKGKVSTTRTLDPDTKSYLRGLATDTKGMVKDRDLAMKLLSMGPDGMKYLTSLGLSPKKTRRYKEFLNRAHVYKLMTGTDFADYMNTGKITVRRKWDKDSGRYVPSKMLTDAGRNNAPPKIEEEKPVAETEKPVHVRTEPDVFVGKKSLFDGYLDLVDEDDPESVSAARMIDNIWMASGFKSKGLMRDYRWDRNYRANLAKFMRKVAEYANNYIQEGEGDKGMGLLKMGNEVMRRAYGEMRMKNELNGLVGTYVGEDGLTPEEFITAASSKLDKDGRIVPMNWREILGEFYNNDSHAVRSAEVKKVSQRAKDVLDAAFFGKYGMTIEERDKQNAEPTRASGGSETAERRKDLDVRQKRISDNFDSWKKRVLDIMDSPVEGLADGWYTNMAIWDRVLESKKAEFGGNRDSVEKMKKLIRMALSNDPQEMRSNLEKLKYTTNLAQYAQMALPYSAWGNDVVRETIRNLTSPRIFKKSPTGMMHEVKVNKDGTVEDIEGDTEFPSFYKTLVMYGRIYNRAITKKRGKRVTGSVLPSIGDLKRFPEKYGVQITILGPDDQPMDWNKSMSDGELSEALNAINERMREKEEEAERKKNGVTEEEVERKPVERPTVDGYKSKLKEFIAKEQTGDRADIREGLSKLLEIADDPQGINKLARTDPQSYLKLNYVFGRYPELRDLAKSVGIYI